MIPENKEAAVKKALQAAFNVDSVDDIQPLTKGLSTALVFQIMVRGNAFLLRVVMSTDAIADPTHYYGSMKVAAANGIAPAIHYLSIEDRISITDFIHERPFPIEDAKKLIPVMLRKLHALPRFPYRMNYFESMERFTVQFRNSNILPATEVEQLFAIYNQIMQVYPRYDTENWVSAHNDCKPENIVFDGRRPWLVDWEAAFLNDPYLDLAMSANFVLNDESENEEFLETYYQRTTQKYQLARFFLMQQILHFYYLIFLMVFDKGEKPIDITSIAIREFRDFHNRIWAGTINLANTQSKREYAIVHKEQFLANAMTGPFQGYLKILEAAKK